MTTGVYDLAIIGGGPAGLAAAATANAGGARVILLDAAESLGGRYYKPPVAGSASPSRRRRRSLSHLGRLVERLADGGIDIITGNRVWGVFPVRDHEGETNLMGSFTIHCDSGVRITTKSIVAAAGVYDRPFPVPGWTLPGVMTPGAAQTLLDRHGVVPGRRVVVGGSGPLQMHLAAELVRSGAEVIALVDTAGPADGLSRAPLAMWSQPKRLGALVRDLWALLVHRVPFHTRSAIVEILGPPAIGVESVVVARLDDGGVVVPGSQETLPADLVCQSAGFIPSVELTMHIGCAHRFDDVLSAFVPEHDQIMRTSVGKVYVAGDITGAKGAVMARLQGKMAAISALEDLRMVPEARADSLRRPLRRKMRRESRFSELIWRRWHSRGADLSLATDETIICRCEGVSVGDIKQACENGARDLVGLKLRTRLGMGICQGRYCVAMSAALLAKETGRQVADMATPSIRPPLFPVRMSDLIDGMEDE